MKPMVPGCEDFEAGCEFMARLVPGRYLHIGDRDNKANFEYLTHNVDINTFGGCIDTHEHPSVCANIPKGEKLKYKGCHFAYGYFRFETDQYDVNPNDVIGNVFIQTIKHRFIMIDYPALKATMWEETFYIDKYGNKWRLMAEDGTVELKEFAKDDFFIWNYADKPLVVYENNFDFKDYDLWRRLEGDIKELY